MIRFFVLISCSVFLVACTTAKERATEVPKKSLSDCHFQQQSKALNYLFESIEKYKYSSKNRVTLYNILVKSSGGGLQKALSIAENGTAHHDGKFQRSWKEATNVPQFLQDQFESIKTIRTTNFKSKAEVTAVFEMLITGERGLDFSYANFLDAVNKISEFCK